MEPSRPFAGASSSSSSAWVPPLGPSSSSSAWAPRGPAEEEASGRTAAVARVANRQLDPAELRALCADDFLLGRTRCSGRAAPALGPLRPAFENRSSADAFDELDRCLECQDFEAAEAIWQTIVTSQAQEVVDLSGHRALAARHARAAYLHVLDELEAALDLQDLASARWHLQQLWELRTFCAGGYSNSSGLSPDAASFGGGAGLGMNDHRGPDRLFEGALSGDCLARGDELESRHRQMSAARQSGQPGALVCGLFPGVSCAYLTRHCFEVVQAMRPGQLQRP